MMISALPPCGTASGLASPVSSAVTVTTALTSRPPAGRYGFWSRSTVNPGRLVIAVSSASLLSSGGSYPGPRADAVGHVHQFDPPLGDQVGERAVAALEPAAPRARALVRLEAEDAPGRGGRRARPRGGRAGRDPVEGGTQDLHRELVAARVVVLKRQPA